jgi:hypothetical protein
LRAKKRRKGTKQGEIPIAQQSNCEVVISYVEAVELEKERNSFTRQNPWAEWLMASGWEAEEELRTVSRTPAWVTR